MSRYDEEFSKFLIIKSNQIKSFKYCHDCFLHLNNNHGGRRCLNDWKFAALFFNEEGEKRRKIEFRHVLRRDASYLSDQSDNLSD